jgi:hypothetical protein
MGCESNPFLCKDSSIVSANCWQTFINLPPYMLKTLHIQNYAIIEELVIDFSKYLNIITGETGAVRVS